MEEVTAHKNGDFVIIHAHETPMWDASKAPNTITFVGQVDGIRVSGGSNPQVVYSIRQVATSVLHKLRKRVNAAGELWVQASEIEAAPNLIEYMEYLCGKFGLTDREAFEFIRDASGRGLKNVLQSLYKRMIRLGVVNGDPNALWSTNTEFCKIKLADIEGLHDEANSKVTLLEDYRQV